MCAHSSKSHCGFAQAPYVLLGLFPSMKGYLFVSEALPNYYMDCRSVDPRYRDRIHGGH